MSNKPNYEVSITGYLQNGTVNVTCTCFSRNAVVNFIDNQLGSKLPKKVEISINRVDPSETCATTQSR